MAVSPPAKIRLVNRVDLQKLLHRLSEDKVIGKRIQKSVFDAANERYRMSYEKAYKYLVRQIIQHLQNGFPGADTKSPNVYIAVQNPFTNEKAGFTANWKPLTPAYRYEKRRAFNNLNTPYQKAKALEDKQRKQKKAIRKNTLSAPQDNSTKFWVFRRNLANAALSAAEMNEQRATVELIKHAVKQRGVLVSGRNKATIRYSVGLRFGRFSEPFDEMVRNPFVTGDEKKARVWDSGLGSSASKGVHIIAWVEAKRPFIVDLSASVGKMVRRRLKI